MEKIFLLLVILPIVTGCSNNNIQDCSTAIPTPHPDDLLDDKLFQLELVDDSQSIKIGDKINLVVKNISDYSIWFPSDLDILIVRRVNEQTFNVVENLSTPVTSNNLILAEANSQGDSYEFSIHPDLINLGKNITIEIYINGYIYDQGEICKGRYYSTISVDLIPPP